MSTRRIAAESPNTDLQLLGTFVVAVVFFGIAVIGGFLAGYRQAIADNGFGASFDALPLIETLTGRQSGSMPAPESVVNPAPPAPRVARQPSAPAAAPPHDFTAPVGTAEAVAQATHVQVLAGPELEGAHRLAHELAAKGYPAVVYSGGADGLHRVILGPYGDLASAEAAQTRLKTEGLDSLIRKP